ncbi:MAG: hypothetical protein H6741_03695 [Alphaproteobacteria bacterium]|nr:hypothetical protein [Alphaproteobacteria bacterium]
MASPDLDVLSPALRSTCRDALIRELLLRTFAHDVRGAVMGVMGWVELAAMEGGRVPKGLSRSLDRLNDVVARYDDLRPASPPTPVELGPLIAAVCGVKPEGRGEPTPVDPLRLLSAMELAGPSRVALNVTHRAGRSRLHLQLEGLDAEGVQLAMAPHYDSLVEHIAARSRALGACLLRVVARSSEAELRGAPPDTLDLYLPLA